MTTPTKENTNVILKAWDMRNGSALVELTYDNRSYSEYHLVIDGCERKLEMYGRPSIIVPMSSLVDASCHVHSYRLGGYRHKATGEIISIEDYEKTESLILNGAYRDEDGDLVYKDLDHEFEHRKFLSKYEQERIPYIAEFDVSFDLRVANTEPSDSYIQPLWHTSTNALEGMGVFVVDRFRLFSDYMAKECHNARLEHDDLNRPEFCKINGEYVFASSRGDYYLYHGGVYRGDIDACRKIVAEDKSRIRRIAAMAKERRDRLTGIEPSTAIDMIDVLRNIMLKIDYLPGKSEHRSRQTQAKDMVRNAITRLEKLITKE